MRILRLPFMHIWTYSGVLARGPPPPLANFLYYCIIYINKQKQSREYLQIFFYSFYWEPKAHSINLKKATNLTWEFSNWLIPLKLFKFYLPTKTSPYCLDFLSVSDLFDSQDILIMILHKTLFLEEEAVV